MARGAIFCLATALAVASFAGPAEARYRERVQPTPIVASLPMAMMAQVPDPDRAPESIPPKAVRATPAAARPAAAATATDRIWSPLGCTRVGARMVC